MEPRARQMLQHGFLTMAQATRSASPVTAALCEGLGSGPSQACEAVFDHYFRIISAPHLNLTGLLAALHHLALQGEAPELARFFPSCGGSFHPTEQQGLTAAAESALRLHREEVLDFLLSQEPRESEPQRAAAVLLGALATADRFRGGLSLVQLGAGDGLLLRFDRYAYDLGDVRIGQSPLTLACEWAGGGRSLLSRGVPAVVGRRGLDRSPVDPTDPAEQRLTESFFAPDDRGRLERFRTACALAADASDYPAIRQGVPELDFARLITEAYNEMAPGNTLFLFSVLAWSRLESEAQKRVALSIQTLASQVQPYKPIAWLQAEPFTPGQSNLELRLHTFGWADLEDRAVRKLAEAAPDLRWVRWLE